MRALDGIHRLDYTVLFARDMPGMRHFYEHVLGFPIAEELGPQWVAYQIGPNRLALTGRGLLFDDPPPPAGALSAQLAFRVAVPAVDQCARELAEAGVPIAAPPTDQPWGHRTLFVRDPDGNVVEIYAELAGTE